MDLTWHMVSKPVIWISSTGIGTSVSILFYPTIQTRQKIVFTV